MKKQEEIEDRIHESPSAEEKKKIKMNIIRPNFNWLKKDTDEIEVHSQSHDEQLSKTEYRSHSSSRKGHYK